MPGGEDYRRWYAMRQRLMKEGKWKGKAPTHSVPAQEEGEPAPKVPKAPLIWRILEPSDSDSSNSEVPPSQAETVPDSNPTTPDSLPPLEASPTAEGNVWFHCFSVGQR